MFDDYVLYLLESLHCQERANDLMRSMKGDVSTGETCCCVGVPLCRLATLSSISHLLLVLFLVVNLCIIKMRPKGSKWAIISLISTSFHDDSLILWFITGNR